jgi:ABC-type transport system involved in cytochrome c biogenesis ATPase subunit
MFKIRYLTINRIEPFAKEVSVNLGPFINIIRGKNGAGKTTILEALAMLGHCCVMDISIEEKVFDASTVPFIDYILVLGSCPFANNSLSSSESLKKLCHSWKEVHKKYGKNITSMGNEKIAEIKIRIKRIVSEHEKVETPLQDLKTDLSDENTIKQRWTWAVKGDDSEQTTAGFIRDLLSFSRPKQILSESQSRQEKLINIFKTVLPDQSQANIINTKVEDAIDNARASYSASERSTLLKQPEYDKCCLPPFISYINTDMYEWGIGLDIRESPKNLAIELPILIEDRLNLTIGDSIIGFLEVQEFWLSIFKDESILEKIVTTQNKAKVTIREGRKPTERDFLSSGENQVLALGLVLCSLKPLNSILLLDEPDLHISLPSARRLYEQLKERCIASNLQTIIVSHLPFYFPHWMHEECFSDRLPMFVEDASDPPESLDKKGFYDILVREKSNAKNPLTLIYLEKKRLSDGENENLVPHPLYQKNAAIEVAKLQSDEIQTILSQTRNDLPGHFEMFKVWMKFINEFCVSARKIFLSFTKNED